MYDVICIGGGLNYAAAVVLAKAGLKVALIEKDLNNLGGTCLNEGCIPSKNLLHRAKTVVESSEDVFKTKAKIDFDKLHEKTAKNLEKNRKGIIAQCKASGIELIEGEAFITDEGVKVNNKLLSAKYIIIGTGASPRIPDGIEVDRKRIITSKEALTLNPPKEITIYGSGAIGLEMAGLFASSGSKVNLVFRHEHISKRMNEEIMLNIEANLKDLGVNLVPNTSIQKAVTKNNKVHITTNNGELQSEYLLVATGRVANTSVIKTDKIKVSKAIDTNEFFETSLSGVYAIGDCNGKLMLAHAARAEALNVAHQILGEKEILNLDNIPKFIYTMPLSYASVGVTTNNSYSFPVSHLGISRSMLDDDRGMVVVYVDEENFLTGAEILAPNAEEIITVFATALAGEMDIATMEKVTFPHPTYSEAIDRVLRRFK